MIFPIYLLANLVAIVSAASAELVYQDEEISWIENIAVAPNDTVLLATATSAKLHQVDIVSGSRRLVYDWSDVANAIMSITDLESGLFLVNTMYCDMSILSVSQVLP